MAKCGKPCEVYSRVVGYHRPVHLWNKGKQAEFAERQTFTAARPIVPHPNRQPTMERFPR